jgi:geranylgeranyl pyrophosphate synthase
MSMIFHKRLLQLSAQRATHLNNCSSKRLLNMEALGKSAANQFLKTVDNNDIIDVPTVCIGDPSNASSWEWRAGLDIKPVLSPGELNTLSKSSIDPFQLVESDLTSLSGGIKDLLGSDHPVLETCAKYFFNLDGGKKIRPAMVLAMSYAIQAHNNSIFNKNSSSNNSNSNNPSKLVIKASPSQKRLAEITEMIHTASLFHDDVIDKAATRRNVDSVNQVFGNKLAILGGDFLLARASVSLARLRNHEVVELMSTVVEHLVKGEVMQMKPSSIGHSALIYYLKKNFYKTASLMGHSCMSAAVLGQADEERIRASYLYGTYVGQAFQLIDDCLDFEGSTASLGKAPLANLKSGLATAPTLFAVEEFPQLSAMISRKFDSPGDIDEALTLVSRSQGLARCRDLAQVHAELAIEAIKSLEPSVARESLIALACKVVNRKH